MDKIIFLDQDLEQKALITNWVSFSFNQQLNNIGSFELVINANDAQASSIEEEQILYFGEDMCGFVENMELVSQDNKANENLIITGIEIKDIISYRATIPATGQENISFTSQRAGYIVGELIDTYLINSTDSTDNIDNLTTSNNDVGTVRDFSSRLKQLDSEIYELLLNDNLGLKGTIDLSSKLMNISVFQGVDRTYNQSVNTRAIFSMKLHSLRSATTVLDISNYKTVGYIAGQGEGVDREIIKVYNDANATGIHKRVGVFDARDAETTEELTARGQSKMLEYGKIYSVQGVAQVTAKGNYNVGDFVTIEDNFGNMDDAQITAIAYSYAGTAPPTISITFGKAPDDLWQAINKRLSGMNNILTN